ncbi:cytochrome b [Comamonas antarctica]|uniref:Cytochrome b n=1 Tax=Comamonas antarctica TaxID=2743470 RepID=A0A6N1X3C9_9BURK|nr:cytochrome b [Comamonas antarctica]QKV52406.1 cytochrome b [Comamonas antarctica]
MSSNTAVSSAPTRYTATAKLLHWVLAIALIGAIGLGLYMVSLSFSPLRLKLYNWHKWLGVSILVLSVVRLGWRFANKPPALPAAMQAAMPAWQHLAHHGTHLALYALFFAVPLLGWAYSSAAGFPIVFLGMLPLPDFVSPSPELAEMIKPLHQWSAYALAALIVLHVAAALKHQFIDRDGLLLRMLPGQR